MTDYCVVMTTFADDENGKRIIETLISKRLAACVQVVPIQSYYHWDGKVNCDAEKLVLIKTRESLYAQVEETIVSMHAYDTPQVTQIPIKNGFPPYLDWISKECE